MSRVQLYFIVKKLSSCCKGLLEEFRRHVQETKRLKWRFLLSFRAAVAAIQHNLLNEFVNQSRISKVEHTSDLAIL